MVTTRCAVARSPSWPSGACRDGRNRRPRLLLPRVRPTDAGDHAVSGDYLAPNLPESASPFAAASGVDHGGRAVASSLSPKHARTGSATDSGGLAFFPSPGPAIGHASSPTSPAFVFSASRTSAPPVRKSGGGSSKKRPRRQHGVVSAPPRSLRQWDAPQQAVQPTHALVTGEASRSSILSGSSARPCCKFFTSPTKASKQEARKASSEESGSTSPCGSPAGSRSTFVPSPAKHSSAEKTRKQDREVEVSSVAREGTTDAEPVA